MSKNITVILGSVRTGRAGKAVADWVMQQTTHYQGELSFTLIDLKEIDLPFMDEPVSPMASDDYVHEHTKQWSRIVNESDGFVFVTPEYNQGYSPVLKNAIDFLHKEWQGKPVGFVGYGGSGAQASIRQLREVLEFIGLKALDDQIGIDKIWEAVDADGNVNVDYIRGDIQQIFAQLEQALNS